jgi:tryptophanyl-tRNA synthetase
VAADVRRGQGPAQPRARYKAAVDKNRVEQVDDDAGITAGLFMYPGADGADILLFNANKVPVGRDQVQHIEMARDFGQRFNHLYGEPAKHFRAAGSGDRGTRGDLARPRRPQDEQELRQHDPVVRAARAVKKLIFAIKTDSRAPGEPKDTQDSALVPALPGVRVRGRSRRDAQGLADGIAWGDAKQQLFERIDREVAPLREKYEALMADPAQIEALLRDGAQRLRGAVCDAVDEALARSGRAARSLDAARAPRKRAKPNGRATFQAISRSRRQVLLQARRWRRVLLQSEGFDSARDAGQLVARAKQDAGRKFTVDADAGVIASATVSSGACRRWQASEDLRAALAQFAEEAS